MRHFNRLEELLDAPYGFAAGDANLRRYVGNGATNGTDPTGLADEKPKATQPNQAKLSFDYIYSGKRDNGGFFWGINWKLDTESIKGSDKGRGGVIVQFVKVSASSKTTHAPMVNLPNQGFRELNGLAWVEAWETQGDPKKVFEVFPSDDYSGGELSGFLRKFTFVKDDKIGFRYKVNDLFSFAGDAKSKDGDIVFESYAIWVQGLSLASLKKDYNFSKQVKDSGAGKLFSLAKGDEKIAKLIETISDKNKKDDFGVSNFLVRKIQVTWDPDIKNGKTGSKEGSTISDAGSLLEQLSKDFGKK